MWNVLQAFRPVLLDPQYKDLKMEVSTPPRDKVQENYSAESQVKPVVIKVDPGCSVSMIGKDGAEFVLISGHQTEVLVDQYRHLQFTDNEVKIQFRAARYRFSGLRSIDQTGDMSKQFHCVYIPFCHIQCIILPRISSQQKSFFTKV